MKKFLKVIPLILFSFLQVLHAQVFGTYSTATGTLNPPGNPAGILLNWPFTGPVIVGGLTASGSAANNFSGSTGTFLTSSGANTFSGAATDSDATTPSFITASGKTNTGFIGVNGKTSGAVKLTCADAAVKIVTINVAAQTVNPATVTIPDMAGTSDTFAFLGKTQTFTGTDTFSGQLIGKGTATNDNAAAGYIGEQLISTANQGAETTLTTATAVNVTAKSLTAGDWEVSGDVTFDPDGSTATTFNKIGISATSLTQPDSTLGDGTSVQDSHATEVPGGQYTMHVGPVRISISAGASYYLVATSNFSVAANRAFGTIRARRIR